MATYDSDTVQTLDTIQLLVRFKQYLKDEGELVGDTDNDTAIAFLKAERAAAIREAADKFEANPDPRFTTPKGSK